MRNLTSMLIWVLSLAATLSGQTRRDAFVLPGDQVVPQVATGGDAFFMSFQFVNFTDRAASVQLSFFDGSGGPMMIPYEQNGVALTNNVLTDTITGGGIGFAVTSSSGPVRIGYALVESIPENAVAVSTAFNQIVPGRPLFSVVCSVVDGVARSVVAWIGAETEFPLSQAVASGDAFEHRPSERGHCVQDFSAELDLRDLPGEAAEFKFGADDALSNGPSAFLFGCAGCTLLPSARPCTRCCGFGQYGDPERSHHAPIAGGSLRPLAAV